MSDVAAWAEDAVARLDAGRQALHESIPIDYLPADAFDPGRAVEQSVLAFRELVLASSAWAAVVMARLSILLPESSTLLLVDSVSGNVREQFDLGGVPGADRRRPARAGRTAADHRRLRLLPQRLGPLRRGVPPRGVARSAPGALTGAGQGQV